MMPTDKHPRKAGPRRVSALTTCLAFSVALATALPALAAPVAPPPADTFVAELRPEAPRYRQSVGLPIIEPIRLLEVFAKVAPMIGAPIVFELRRPHPVLGERQVTTPDKVIELAEALDGAGLGLADISVIHSDGLNGRLTFEVDQRRLEIEGPESLVSFALPLMDQALYTSPLDVTLVGTAQQPELAVTNRGAEAWLVTEVRLGESRKQHLSRPLSGKIKPTDKGVQITREKLTVGLESAYDGLVPPGETRRFQLRGPVPAGATVPINLVAYRLDDPFVLAGLFLLPKKASNSGLFKAAEPPWDQWQSAPLLMLGPWPPALIVLRQCQLDALGHGQGRR